eukprot:gene20101-20644_t
MPIPGRRPESRRGDRVFRSHLYQCDYGNGKAAPAIGRAQAGMLATGPSVLARSLPWVGHRILAGARLRRFRGKIAGHARRAGMSADGLLAALQASLVACRQMFRRWLGLAAGNPRPVRVQTELRVAPAVAKGRAAGLTSALAVPRPAQSLWSRTVDGGRLCAAPAGEIRYGHQPPAGHRAFGIWAGLAKQVALALVAAFIGENGSDGQLDTVDADRLVDGLRDRAEKALQVRFALIGPDRSKFVAADAGDILATVDECLQARADRLQRSVAG